MPHINRIVAGSWAGVTGLGALRKVGILTKWCDHTGVYLLSFTGLFGFGMSAIQAESAWKQPQETAGVSPREERARSILDLKPAQPG